MDYRFLWAARYERGVTMEGVGILSRFTTGNHFNINGMLNMVHLSSPAFLRILLKAYQTWESSLQHHLVPFQMTYGKTKFKL